MSYNSIRSKVALLFVPLIIIPLLVAGVIGALYFQDVLKHSIWDNNMGQAETISELTASYVNLSENYLTSIADRPLVIRAVEERNWSFLNETTRYIAEQSVAFDSAFTTDSSGRVMSYDTIYTNYTNFTYPDIIGRSFLDRPYVGPVLNTSRPIAIATGNDIDGSSTIYVGAPIRGPNDTTIGTVVGIYDMKNFTNSVIGTAARNGPYVYLVNGSGNIIVHSNPGFMSSMSDFSRVPAVRDVMEGKKGVAEQYNPIEKDDRLVAYYPVNSTGWGVVVAVPSAAAYQPVTNTLWAISAVTLALAAISLALAYAFSKSITDPILGLYNAARAITNSRDYRQYLPMKRKDEIGQVAVCMDNMATRIAEDREKLVGEKNRAELYLDIMGHDINNLNQVTIGNLELISEDPNLTAEQKESIADALGSASSSAGIIDNVRRIQAINERQEAFQPEDINDMIIECIRDAPNPADKKVTITYAPKKGLIIEGPALMKEVFCNLVGNAIKHSGGDVTVDIVVQGVERAGKKFYDVSVADNGPGIPDGIKARLFNRFQRGETKAHGRGLGLFIARSLAESIGGDIRVEDRVPGDSSKGARFVVSLPVREEEK
ncbi:MAG TPA: sensor histidine kinase [Methanocella sp.]|uniref:sensor histidine kinase n=1 Tax=Methanocella sp. TaxID=2052833 RepID=UPI002C4C2957|nr:sensor histidine kinase [Methanocella sp.]HTY91053.1 sensor histidine kinase [Methanocella sp.]